MPEFLTLEEIADTLNVSVRTLRRRCAEGELPYYMVGGLIRVSKCDFENYLKSNKKGVKEK